MAATPLASPPAEQPRPKKSRAKGKIISAVDEEEDEDDEEDVEGEGEAGEAEGGRAGKFLLLFGGGWWWWLPFVTEFVAVQSKTLVGACVYKNWTHATPLKIRMETVCARVEPGFDMGIA